MAPLTTSILALWSEFKEINKILLGYSQSTLVKQKDKQPDPKILAQEVQYLDQRFNEALKSYNQFLTMTNDTDEALLSSIMMIKVVLLASLLVGIWSIIRLGEPK